MPRNQFDIDRDAKQNSTALVPAGDSTKSGFRLTWIGPGAFDFDWVQDSEGQILKGVGSPDGVVFAPKSTLYQERDEPGLWQNTDGLQAWRQVGAVTANVSGYYVIGTPVVTNVPDSSVTNLGWPGFTIGTDILDLSTVDTPLTTAAGEWTFNVTVALAAGEAPGDQVLVLIRLTDGTTPYGAETHATLLGSASDDDVISLSLTAVLAAGATVEVKALQTSGSTIALRMDVAAVTGPPS